MVRVGVDLHSPGTMDTMDKIFFFYLCIVPYGLWPALCQVKAGLFVQLRPSVGIIIVFFFSVLGHVCHIHLEVSICLSKIHPL